LVTEPVAPTDRHGARRLHRTSPDCTVAIGEIRLVVGSS